MGTIDTVELNIAEKLKDEEYRRGFFEAGARFGVQDRIRDLIKIRKSSQLELAENCGMKPSAMSRVLSDGYASWNFKTLLRIADALDAELRISFVLAEDVIAEYEQAESRRRNAGVGLGNAESNAGASGGVGQGEPERNDLRIYSASKGAAEVRDFTARVEHHGTIQGPVSNAPEFRHSGSSSEIHAANRAAWRSLSA